MEDINMLLSDSHIHTMFSSDSEENPVNVVNNAISLGFKHICFTDHNDFDAPLEDGKVMFDLDFEEYIKYFQNLKESYKDKINIHIGVEQGLMRSVADRVNAYDSEKQLDFIIGSSHLVYGEDPSKIGSAQRCIHSLRRAGDADKGGVSLFQKEIPLPYTLPEKIRIAGL